METVYRVTGYVKRDLKEVDERVTARDETEAIQQIESKYGEGQYNATLVKGKING